MGSFKTDADLLLPERTITVTGLLPGMCAAVYWEDTGEVLMPPMVAQGSEIVFPVPDEVHIKRRVEGMRLITEHVPRKGAVIARVRDKRFLPFETQCTYEDRLYIKAIRTDNTIAE